MAGHMLFKKDIREAPYHEGGVVGLFSSTDFFANGTQSYDSGLDVIAVRTPIGHSFVVIPSFLLARANRWVDMCQDMTAKGQSQAKIEYKELFSTKSTVEFSDLPVFDGAAADSHEVRKGGSDLVAIQDYAGFAAMGLFGDAEIKADMASIRYGNFYFEVMQNAKNLGTWYNSGLRITESDQWIHVGGEKSRARVVCVMNTDGLKETVTKNRGKNTNLTHSDNPTKGWTLPVPLFMRQT